MAAAALAATVVVAIAATGRIALPDGADSRSPDTVVTHGSHLPTGDAWTERLTDPSFWRDGDYVGGGTNHRPRRVEESVWRDNDEDRDDDDGRRRPRSLGFGGSRGTYRTVCVRLCDGYFFPISFAVTPDRFARDAAACESSCRTSARLYVYPNPGGEPEQMTDLEGAPYTALKSAFLFRTNYDAACTCKPHPWEKESLDRHRAYAEADSVTGDRTRTVARTIRSEPHRARAVEGSRRSRPEGAMLLGADASSSPRRSRRAPRAREARAPEERRSSFSGSGSRSSSDRGGDWRQRAFEGGLKW